MAKRRRRRSPAERAALVQAWERSGRSVREFCDREGLVRASFYRWRREPPRARPARRRAPRAAVAATPAVVPVHVVGREPAAPLELVLRSGRRVRCHGDVDAALLARVVTVLETVTC